jgi:transposase
MSDEAWSVLESYPPGQKGHRGGAAKDDRSFIDGGFRIARAGAPWRDLTSEWGRWGATRRPFIRRRDKPIGGKLLEAPIGQPDFERLMIAAGH